MNKKNTLAGQGDGSFNKGFAVQHESLNSISRTHIKVLGTEASACNHRIEERHKPRVWLAAQVAWMLISSPLRNPALHK